MPKVSKVARHVSLYEEIFVKLHRYCDMANPVFRGAWKVDTYVYELESKKYITHNGPAMLAVQEFEGNRYAIYAHDYLSDTQLAVFEYFVERLEKGAEVRVFTQRNYDAMKKYCKGKDVNIIYKVR